MTTTEMKLSRTPRESDLKIAQCLAATVNVLQGAEQRDAGMNADGRRAVELLSAALLAVSKRIARREGVADDG